MLAVLADGCRMLAAEEGYLWNDDRIVWNDIRLERDPADCSIVLSFLYVVLDVELLGPRNLECHHSP